MAKDKFSLAKSLNKASGIKETKYLHDLRKKSVKDEKKFDKEHAKYLKERKARYKREGITE